MNNTNRAKAQQLGMPFGTAMAKLRKQLLFSLLKKYNENVCYRCEKPIECVEQLSVDHKKPWLRFDTNLFWDVNNIAFSHLDCNVNARNTKNAGKPRINSPTGTSWCSSCKQNKSITMFSKNKGENGRDGIHRECKDCRKIRSLKQRKT